MAFDFATADAGFVKDLENQAVSEPVQLSMFSPADAGWAAENPADAMRYIYVTQDAAVLGALLAA